MKITKALIFGLIILLLFAGCYKKKAVKINTQEILDEEGSLISTQDELTLGIFCFKPPVELFKQYKPLTNYLQDSTGENIKLCLFESNYELYEALKKRKVDIVIISDAMFSILLLNKNEDYEIIGVPVQKNSFEYECNIIVPKDSVISDFKDLKGKSFAVSDVFSIPGYYYPSELAAGQNLKYIEYFSGIVYLESIYDAVNFVANKKVSGASIPSFCFQDCELAKDALNKKIKIINTSDTFVRGPVVIRSGIDDDKKIKIANTLLKMHLNEKGFKILEEMKINMFVKITPDKYSKAQELVKKYFEPE